jgi:hypothetical protein
MISATIIRTDLPVATGLGENRLRQVDARSGKRPTALKK